MTLNKIMLYTAFITLALTALFLTAPQSAYEQCLKTNTAEICNVFHAE